MTRTMQTRRQLLAVAMTAPATLVLANCGSLTLSQVETDIQTIANGVAAIPSSLLSDAAAIAGVTSATITAVKGYVADIGAIAADVGAAAASTLAVPATALSKDIAALVTALTGVKVPAFVTTILDAATSLLPTVLTVAGIALAPAAPLPMSPARARAVLLAAAVK